MRTIKFFVLSLLGILTLAGCQQLQELNIIDNSNKSPQEISSQLIQNSQNAFVSIIEDEQIGKIFLKNFKSPDVVGIIITPNLLQGGFFLGGSGGSGVLLARAANGEWSYPVFIRQGSGSFGLQIGFQSAQVASLITSSEQLSVLLNGSPIAGGQAGGVVLDEGSGFDYSGGLDITSALRSYGIAKGAYVGADIKLGGLWSQSSLNQIFYGDTTITPEQVVLEARFQNPKADDLRNTLMRYQNN